MTTGRNVVLSTLEFDVLWEAERLPRRHPALDVPSAGVTQHERSDLIEQAWDSLAQRRLAKGRQATSDLVDLLNLFVRPAVAIDMWVWTDRQISGLAVSTGSQALMGVLDGDEVWLIPARDSSLPESAVSVSGGTAAGIGWSATLPHDVLVAADREAGGDARTLVGVLADRGIALSEAQEVAAMLAGQTVRGQFGAQVYARDGSVRRAPRVVSFFDSDKGRYLLQVAPGSDGRQWATVAPADNTLLAQRVWELLDET
ncbi:ESX secretion-associated protein EspG [Prauserella halophila]|uniref:ESX secretion-associated protein EspG n=1 Tax=Prauserella halophila TaxID=185641 RepID=A0ABP4GZ26_9PSEU|nr:ESX secretion-associated protein EspG [Prauserella halophila]MCP2236893.1 EspG family protein [Prauserella halophila]